MTLETSTGEVQAKREPTLKNWLTEMKANLGLTGEKLREALRYDFKQNNLIEWDSRFDEMFDLWFRIAEHKRSGNSSDIIKTLVFRGLEQLEKKVEERANVKLLEMQMPNGKELGDCTGYEITRMSKTYGPFLQRLAKRVKPRQYVKNAISEEQAKTLYETSGLNASR